MSALKLAAHPAECLIDGDRPPLVAAGIYDLAFVHYETVRLYGGRAEKIALWWRIVSLGTVNGVVLPRYYNVKTLVGKPGKGGRFRIGWKSDFVREYALLYGLPSRLDRIAMTRFHDSVVVGRVRGVSRDYRDREIPKDLCYSVVGELLKVKEL
jgi:hypothetical protein